MPSAQQLIIPSRRAGISIASRRCNLRYCRVTHALTVRLVSHCGALLPVYIDFADISLPTIAQPRIRGPIVHHARIAALCLAHGVEELVTKDRDFQLFPQLKTLDPF